MMLTTKYRHRVPERSVVYVPWDCKQSPHRRQSRQLLCWPCNRDCCDIGGLYNRTPTPALVGSLVQFWSPFCKMLKIISGESCTNKNRHFHQPRLVRNSPHVTLDDKSNLWWSSHLISRTRSVFCFSLM